MVLLLESRFTTVFLSCALLAVAGCSRGVSKAATYPVHGKVTWHGEPVRFAKIRFKPDGSGFEADGRTEEDGSFTLRTYSNDEPDGAVPGEYQVVLESWDNADGEVGPIPKGAKPTTFPGELQAPEPVEVKAEDNDLNIEIP